MIEIKSDKIHQLTIILSTKEVSCFCSKKSHSTDVYNCPISYITFKDYLKTFKKSELIEAINNVLK